VPGAKEQKKLLRDLGANIRRERSARGITQEKLAELADLNIRTIQKIECGELNVLITTAIRIQRALECRWNRLIPSGDNS
jgi:transcriptional regulator with XRE-family HTH domain